MDVRARDSSDGFVRRRFTNEDVRRMIDAGVIGDDEAFELLGGEVAAMAPEMDAHYYGRNLLLRSFIRQVPDTYIVATEASLFLNGDTEVRPDLQILPSTVQSDQAIGADVLLAVEIAVSSQVRDFDVKKPLYASAGVRELWILDLDARRAHVFRDPDGSDYRLHQQFAADEPVSALEFPQVAIRLRDLLR